MQTLTVKIAAVAAVAIALAAGTLAWQGVRHDQVPQTGTAYQSVALINGQLYFGRVIAVEGDYLQLRDVYYVQTRQDPDTHATANVLTRRGSEPHRPDVMLINRSQVLLIESVQADSQIAKLIAEQPAGGGKR
jgi:hypothetical protein